MSFDIFSYLRIGAFGSNDDYIEKEQSPLLDQLSMFHFCSVQQLVKMYFNHNSNATDVLKVDILRSASHYLAI